VAEPAPRSGAPNGGSIFSVPVIGKLEDGKQYVQIGAFVRPDTLETAVARADRGYPLAIQTGGSKDTLVYRLLIGPLNAGESAAALQRVRNSGFPDAFVRSSP
jgi:cell division septation protein DedD